jgi:hypothetical protein
MEKEEAAGGSKNQEGLTDEQRAAKLERIRKSQRDYYQRNKHWLLEEARKKQEVARRAAGKPKRKKAKKKPKLTKAREKALRESRLESLKKAQQVRAKKQEEWTELGWVVAKMNREAKMSQEAIYQVLGGLATRKQIAEWCLRGKKAATIKRPKPKPCLSSSPTSEESQPKT